MVDSTPLEQSTGLLAAVADPLRWQVLRQLRTDATVCVCELRTEPAIAANLLSYHLKVLREAGLVVATRRGRWIDYRLADDAADRLRAALPTETGLRHGPALLGESAVV